MDVSVDKLESSDFSALILITFVRMYSAIEQVLKIKKKLKKYMIEYV